MKYINQFIKLNCSPDILVLKVFPNIKEITESMSVKNHLYSFWKNTKHELNQKDSNLTVIVPGDGRNPRTGVLFAFTSAHKVISIDPLLKENWINQIKVKRLTCIKDKAENVKIDQETIAIILPHSHCNLQELITKWTFKTAYIVSMPCCFLDKQILKNKKGFHIKDCHVLSPKNDVFGYLIEK